MTEPLAERLTAAQMLYNARKFDEALVAYRQLSAEGHRDDPVLLGLGLAEVMAGDLAAADAAFAAIADLPPKAEAWWAYSLQCRDRFAEARVKYESALRGDPDLPEALLGLGICLLKLEALDESEAVLKRAIVVSPASAHPRLHLASLYRKQGRLADALAEFNAGMPLLDAGDPLEVIFRVEHGFTALTLGDFTTGFSQFEWRLRGVLKPAADRMAAFAPPWDGKVVAGRRVLLWYEQGLGDFIHFVRYATKLAEWGMRVVLLAPVALRRLVATTPGVEAVVVDGEDVPPVDCQAAIMSIPHLLMKGGTSLTIPRTVPYLHPAPEEVAAWRARLEPVAGGRRRIGIAWCGNPKFAFNHRRAIPVEQLAPILKVPGAAFFSIQVGDDAGRAKLAALGVTDLIPQVADYADTAAAMCALDQIITIDTSVAHCAGALGRPTWVFMPKIWDWRWGIAGSRSMWYPTMRLFRQDVLDEWAPVIDRVAAALSAELGGGCA